MTHTASTSTPTSELLADPTQVALLRELFAHARQVKAPHNTYAFVGVTGRPYGPVEHTWTLGSDRVTFEDGDLVYLRHGAQVLKARVTTVGQAAQLLAAIGVLPERFIVGGTR